jgi:hypothetical protein
MIGGLEEKHGNITYVADIPSPSMTVEHSTKASNVRLHFDTMMIEKTDNR